MKLRGGARPNSGPAPAERTVDRAMDSIERWLDKAAPDFVTATRIYHRMERLTARAGVKVQTATDNPDMCDAPAG